MSCLEVFAKELPAHMLVCVLDRDVLRHACASAGVESMAEMLSSNAREAVLESISRAKGVGPARAEKWERILFPERRKPCDTGIPTFDRHVELSIKNALRKSLSADS